MLRHPWLPLACEHTLNTAGGLKTWVAQEKGWVGHDWVTCPKPLLVVAAQVDVGPDVEAPLVERVPGYSPPDWQVVRGQGSPGCPE